MGQAGGTIHRALFARRRPWGKGAEYHVALWAVVEGDPTAPPTPSTITTATTTTTVIIPGENGSGLFCVLEKLLMGGGDLGVSSLFQTYLASPLFSLHQV